MPTRPQTANRRFVTGCEWLLLYCTVCSVGALGSEEAQEMSEQRSKPCLYWQPGFGLQKCSRQFMVHTHTSHSGSVYMFRTVSQSELVNQEMYAPHCTCLVLNEKYGY